VPADEGTRQSTGLAVKQNRQKKVYQKEKKMLQFSVFWLMLIA